MKSESSHGNAIQLLRSLSGVQGGDVNFYPYTLNNPINRYDHLGLASESTGVNMCFRLLGGDLTPDGYPTWFSVWHVYLQIGASWESDWTRGYAGRVFPEKDWADLERNTPRFCNELRKKFWGSLPDGTPCRCATPEQIQRCVKNEDNFPDADGKYHGVFRNCAHWASRLARKCCLKPDYRGPKREWWRPRWKFGYMYGNPSGWEG